MPERNRRRGRFSKLGRPRTFSRTQLIIFVVIFGAISGYLLYRSFAALPVVAILESEQMSLPSGSSVFNDVGASGGQAIQYSLSGTSSGSVNSTDPVSTVTVRARADKCRSGWPSVTLSVDSNQLLSDDVTSTGWTYYSATVSLPSGNHTVGLSANLAAKGDDDGRGHSSSSGTGGCTSSLYVDSIIFYGDALSSMPAPTVALSATPSSVSTGQASTLTWTSTNADSCSSSGAWSGTKHPSGSTSTGALNQISTYTLTCMGNGGSASASTTVTVSPAPVPSAPSIYINPASQTYSLGTTFTIEVRENSGTTGVNAVQANISYPTDKLKFVRMDASSSAFPIEAQSSGGSGKIGIARGIIGSLRGDQLVAKITFRVNSTAGTASLGFTSGTSLVSAAQNQELLGSVSATGSATYTLQ